jgi:NAD(P)-dependent dehydrogenase (short-subunit alcohol dehydrogenase family)
MYMSYVQELFDLSGKKVIITGGGGVIAGAMATALLKSGANIALWGHRSPSLESARASLSAELTTENGKGESRICTVVVDTGEEKAVSLALGETEKQMGSPNVLINAVGGTRGKSAFVDTDIETFDSVLRLNLIAGLMVPTKVVARYWIEKHIKGAIINLASMSSYIPLSGVWAYDAAKAGVQNLTMATAKEFAPHGIRVNAIAPGFFIGKQNKALLIKNEDTGELTERGQMVVDHTPFGRFGEVSELAGATIFLCSHSASGFITGITLPVDGGYLVHNI